MIDRILDFIIRFLLRRRWPHLANDEEGGASIHAYDAEGFRYTYEPTLGIFDPDDNG